MQKTHLFLFLFFASALVIFLASTSKTALKKADAPTEEFSSQKKESPDPSQSENLRENKNDAPIFSPPLPNSQERITKKPFGLFVTPQNSPVSPERFFGYHTGIDLEVFPDEIAKDVTVQAVCPGEVLLKRSASGYGGVLVQKCLLEKENITVVYGHLRLKSITKNVGENLAKEETIGVLGSSHSAETDGERKHLHLAFHKGNTINILGYVQNKIDLLAWLDPQLYIF